FHSPLVSDLISEITDLNEQNAQRVSLLRRALTDDFLNDLAHKYKVFDDFDEESQITAAQRENLLKKIEYFSISPTNFQISATSNNPLDSFEMTKAVLKQIMDTLIEERYKTFVKARDGISSQVQFL